MDSGVFYFEVPEFLPLTTLYLSSFGRVVMLGNVVAPPLLAPLVAAGLFIFAACLDAEFPFGLLPDYIMRARISNWWG